MFFEKFGKVPKYSGKSGNILMRPKKSPHFILVEESGTNTLDKFGKKTPPKNCSYKTNENLYNLNETN